MTDQEIEQQMADMKSFDEPLSSTTPHLHRQVWAKPIESQLYDLVEQEFALPYFEFVYDRHWDLGHGWSGDL